MRRHKRVYEVAKKHHVSSEVLMGVLERLEIEANSHMDRVEEDDISAIEDWFEKYPDGTPPEEPETSEEPREQTEAAETPEVLEKSQEPQEEPAVAEEPPAPQPGTPAMPPPETAGTRPVMPPVPTDAPAMPPIPTGSLADRPPIPPELQAPSAKEKRETAREETREGEPEKPEAAEQAPEPESAPPKGTPKPREKSQKTEAPAPEPKARQKRRDEGEGDRGQPAARRGGGKSRDPGRKMFTIGSTTDLGEATGAGSGGSPRRRGKRRKKKAASQAEIQASVQKTLTQMGRGRVKKSYDRPQGAEDEEITEETPALKVSEFTSVSELADLMGVKATEVIAVCMQLGLMVSINQRLEWDTITLIADEFGFEIEKLEDADVDAEEEVEEEAPEDLEPRSPVVTVMGHVDHGKTSLLDYIRRTNVIAGESGGITQHIGAYVVKTDQGNITFLDTPGHEAFTAMRSRGTQVTDVVVLVIAADDAVMPQTVEAINHARAAGVPMVIAINKIDLPGANVSRIKQELTQHEVVVEEFGGQTQCVEISAKTGESIDALLETLALETELLELTANPNRSARGAVVEARLDRGRGAVATVLVEAGTLRVGDAFVAGMCAGRVRAMLDERGNSMEEAGPSTPVQVLGFDDIPNAGDALVVYEDEREARQLAQHRQQLRREQEYNRIKKVNLADLHRRISEGEIRTLPVIVKGDVDGSVEALSDELARLSNPEVGIEVIHRGVGAITEGDVLLASASNAIIIGFHVRAETRARELANQEQVEIRLYSVIYEAVEDVKNSLAGLLDAVQTEEILGEAEVRELFKISRLGTIAGCYVQSGAIPRNANVRVIRDGAQVWDGRIDTLRREKDDAREVQSGFECGIFLENYNDVKVGDIIEAYTIREEARTLESVVEQVRGA